jgi:peptidoglycan hydrolase CwlO-like protein
MMKQMIRVLTCAVLLGLLPSLIGCSGVAEQEVNMDSLTLDLEKAEAAKEDLIARMEIVMRVSDHLQEQLRTQLQERVDSLTQSQGQLKEQINELTGLHAELQERINSLARSRDAAVAEAREAREERDALRSQLAAEENVGGLRDQLQEITGLQGALAKLQSEPAQIVNTASDPPASAAAAPGDSAGMVAPGQLN